MKTTIFSLLIALLFPFISAAKTYTHDSEIRQGRLSNGLTYYIIPNYHSGWYVHLFLATNVGSVVEKPEEYGMAHFIEHCVFDGSKNFPDKSLKTQLENIGLKFGRDFNANTTYDFTTYYTAKVNGLSMDVIRQAMTALHDMGNCADITDETVESERKIILEEWRQGDGAQHRIAEQMTAFLLGEDNPYSHPIIGTEETISSFTPEGLREFYHKWYQPHHQALIVVGSVEPGEIIKIIKQVWKDVPAAPNPSVRQWTQVPDYEEMRATVITDPEFKGCQIDMWFPAKPSPRELRNTSEYFNEQLPAYIAGKIAEERMQDIMFSPDTPWSAAHADWDQFYCVDCRDAFRFYALYDRNIRNEAVERLITEAKRLAEHGVSQAELDRAIDELRAHAKKLDKDYEEISTMSAANKMMREFNTGNVFLDGKTEKKIYESFCDSLQVSTVNAFLKQILRPDNLAISITESLADGVDYPTMEGFLAMAKKMWADAKPEAMADDASLDRPLIDHELTPGTILGMSEDSEFEAKLYTLSNGANVAVAFRDNESDLLTVRAVQRGGESVMLGQSFAEGYFGPTLLNQSGMGDFSALDLRRKLAGTKVDIDIRHHPYSEIIEGECRVKELETLLQLLHLRMTTVREDTTLFANWKRGQIGKLNDLRFDPDNVFSDSLRSMLYGHDNIYMRRPTAADIDTLDYHKALNMMRARMENAANWDFIITGNVKWKDTEKLICKYIGSLPGDGFQEAPEHHVVPRKAIEGSSYVRFDQVMEKPLTRVYQTYELHRPYTLEDEMALEVLKEILRKVFIEIIREQAGAAYSPSVGCASSEVDGLHSLFVSIDTNAEMAAPISQAISGTLTAMARHGIDEEIFAQVMRTMREEEGLEKFYQGYPMRYYTHQMLYHDRHVAERADALKQVTLEGLQQLVNDLMRAPARYSLIMNGR